MQIYKTTIKGKIFSQNTQRKQLVLTKYSNIVNMIIIIIMIIQIYKTTITK